MKALAIVPVFIALIGFGGGVSGSVATAAAPAKVTPATAPLDPLVLQGVEWLAKAQHPDGGWGAGSHANQQLRDPHQVVTGPATTSFVAMALVRTGSTPGAGPPQVALKSAPLC